jgi:hypothetical protein
MPLYYFDILTSTGEVLHDDTGTELPDVIAVRLETRLIAERFQRDAATGGRNYAGCMFSVRAADGRQMFCQPIFPSQ